ncbi:MAG: hypothetical protein ACRDGV_11440 [Candidatus Limnocylindria bacterium]
MPRRAGKAASRKARQRKVRRANPPVATTPTIPAPPATPVTRVPPVGTPEAREAASLTPRQRATPTPTAVTGSLLTDRERAEYHYVERDLRNIGILTVVMVALLLVAWLAFSALGLVG